MAWGASGKDFGFLIKGQMLPLLSLPPSSHSEYRCGAWSWAVPLQACVNKCEGMVKTVQGTCREIMDLLDHTKQQSPGLCEGKISI